MTTEAKITVMRSEAEECWQPPEAGRGEGNSLPEPLTGTWPC